MPTHTSKNTLKWIAIIGGLGAAFAIFKIVRASRQKSIDHTSADPGKPQPAPLPGPSSSFPVKNGSQSDMVKQLQGYLGVAADGVFGPKTGAALLLQTGKLSIANQDEFNSVITSLQAKAAASAGSSRASKLIASWQSNPSLCLIANTAVAAIGITEDAYGALTANGKNIGLVPGFKYNRQDYQLISSTQAGFLKFKVTTGDRAGLYKVDANKVSVG